MFSRGFPENSVEPPDRAVEDSWQVVPRDGNDTCQSEPELQERDLGENDIAFRTPHDQELDPASYCHMSDIEARSSYGLTRKDLAMCNLHTASAAQAAGTAPEVKARADRLRDKLCLTRVQLDIERDRYLATCRFLEDSAQELIALLIANPNIVFGPESSQLELQRLQDQAKLSQDALLQQSKVTRDLEATLRAIEARIARLGVWMVHIPDPPMD